LLIGLSDKYTELLRCRRIQVNQSDIELISLHIPKTAGSSFRETLRADYGEVFFCIYKNETDVPIGCRAVHGHFEADLFDLSKANRPKIITWLRDPVERAISYYSYWSRFEKAGSPGHQWFLDERPTMIEFAEKILRNELHNYLKGLSIRDFDFVGIVEHFDEDIIRYQNWFDTWTKNSHDPKSRPKFRKLRKHRLNVTKNKIEISEADRNKINDILQFEINTYEEACQMRLDIIRKHNSRRYRVTRQFRELFQRS
jgi:hypothetical protein